MPTQRRGGAPRRPGRRVSKAGEPRPEADEIKAGRSTRNHLERELADSRAIQRAIVDSTSDLIWAVDAEQFGLIFFNRGLEEYFAGRGIKIKIGDRPEELFPPGEFVERWHGIYDRALEVGSYTVEYKVFTGQRLLELTVNVLKRDDDVFGISVFGKDVTDRSRAEQQLRESEERWRTIFTSHAAAIALARRDDHKLVDVNDAFQQLTGFSREEALGNSTVELGLFSQRERDRLGEVRFRQGGAHLEVEIVRKDGELRQVSLSSAVLNVAGETLLLSIGQDVTDRKRADEELRTLRERLYHQDRVVRAGEIAASLAHELNQPLTGILSGAQAARTHLGKGEPDLREVGEIVDEIIDDANRAGAIIHRLRSFLRKDVSHRERVDINSLTTEVMKLVSSDLALANVVVSTDLGARLPSILADRVQVQQVILNLLNNAEHAVTSGWDGERHIELSTSSSTEEITICVRDSGPGIAPDALRTVFEPFYSTKPTGMGLGLAISRSIVEAHGGRIWAENNPEGGARMSFTLPIEAAE